MSLKIQNYSVAITELNREILTNASLEVQAGEIIVLVGANGSGKSSFAMSLLGIPEYHRSGSVKVDETETIDLEIDEIARCRLFVSFQSPPEIEGVSLFDFINSSYRSIHPKYGLSTFKLRKKIMETAKQVGLNESFLERSTNQGFSGGERRKSEVLQMLILDPKVAVLDEVDSGLDIQSTHKIATILKDKVAEHTMGLVVISHSPEFIRKLQPNRIVELKDKQFSEVSIEDIEQFVED
ncbi:MAG: ATP-binding cassette domain-containing protein [Candidatus Dojkabacteria bacterium]